MGQNYVDLLGKFVIMNITKEIMFTCNFQEGISSEFKKNDLRITFQPDHSVTLRRDYPEIRDYSLSDFLGSFKFNELNKLLEKLNELGIEYNGREL